MNKGFQPIIFGAIIALWMATASTANATIKPFLPPQPLEGESRAYNELIQTISMGTDQQRILRNLNLARSMTAGPTMLRAYIDCMRVGPLMATGDTKLALLAADECNESYGDLPFPRFVRAMARMHSYDNPKLLMTGADDLVAILNDFPTLYQAISFEELASPMRGLTAAGEEKRKAALVKAYFNPLYAPSPKPGLGNSLVSGIGVLLENDEVALASRLAGFLQTKRDVVGLLSFLPAKPIWPALEARHLQGYDAAQKAWEILDKNITEFNGEKIAMLSALKRWDELETQSLASIAEWDGKDSDAEIVTTINAAANVLWNGGQEKKSIALSKSLISKAGENADGQITNTAYNAGYRLILLGQLDEGRNLLKRHIAIFEEDPSNIEWQSGAAFLNAVRVCAQDGKSANHALSKLETAKGDLYNQKVVAYSCLDDTSTMATLMSDRLNNGSLYNRMRMAIDLAHMKDISIKRPSTQFKAMELEPLRSSIAEQIRKSPHQQ